MRGITELEKHQKKWVEWRHHLHRNPELSCQEKETLRFVSERLKAAGIAHEQLAGGVVAWLENPDPNTKAPAIGLRADMDALPICEENRFAHKSINEGVMHACGHDGHTAMLLAAADFLAAHTERLPGRIYFIFQPAEEGGGGAKRMIQEGLFRKFPMHQIFGLHNWPGLPVGTFAVFPKEVMAAVNFFNVEICGSGGHAAMPQLATDVLVAASYFVAGCQTIISRSLDPLKAAVMSVTEISGGENHNVLPSKVNLKGTLRYFEEDVRDHLVKKMKSQLEGVCKAQGVTGTLECIADTIATINNPDASSFAAQAAQAVSDKEVLKDLPPSMGGEDFAYMLKESPGSYIWLGNGDTSSLHTPNYDFNDKTLLFGVQYWCQLACQLRITNLN